jgi:hypothetical protein
VLWSIEETCGGASTAAELWSFITLRPARSTGKWDIARRMISAVDGHPDPCAGHQAGPRSTNVVDVVLVCRWRRRQAPDGEGLGAQPAAYVGEDIADLVTDDSEDDDHDDGYEYQNERVLNHPLTLLASGIGASGEQAEAVGGLTDGCRDLRRNSHTWMVPPPLWRKAPQFVTGR